MNPIDRNCDVLVVGAGIVGAACAWRLAREGLQVTLIDAGCGGAGATAEGMGHLVILDDSPAQLALTRHSLDLWSELAPELAEGCEFRRSGTLWLAETDEDLANLEAKAALYAGHGLAHELLDGDELRRREPNLAPRLPGALAVPGDAVVYPPRVTTELIARAQRDHGLVWRPNTPIAEVASDGDSGARVRTTDGACWRAGHVVLAAGHRSFELLDELPPGLSLTPRKGHLLITARHPGFCRHQLVEVGYLRSAHGHGDEDTSGSGLPAGTSVAFNLQPRPNGQMLLGSSRQHGEASRTIERALVAAMVRRSLDFVPGLAELAAIRIWTGLRAATPDPLPYLGPLPGQPRVLLATGHEGLGITTSLVSAELIADHLLERPSAIPREPYDPARHLRTVLPAGASGPTLELATPEIAP